MGDALVRDTLFLDIVVFPLALFCQVEFWSFWLTKRFGVGGRFGIYFGDGFHVAGGQ